MGTVVALANSKDGVGKTTLAVHLAGWSQETIGHTAFVDADVRGTGSSWLRQASPEAETFRLLTPDEILDEVPELTVQFDVLVIDGPSGLPEVTRAILLVAHLALVPCGRSTSDVRAVHEAIHVVSQAPKIRNGPPQAALVPNKLHTRYRPPRELSDTLKSLGVSVVGGLHIARAFADAAAQQTLVWRLGACGKWAVADMTEIFGGFGLHGTGAAGDTRAPLA
jgi:chromosome partitioning protein